MTTRLEECLAPVQAPDELWRRIERSLDQPATPRPARNREAWLAVAAAVLLTIAVGMSWAFRDRTAEWARLARAAHTSHAAWALESSNALDLRAWALRNCALDVRLPDAAPENVQMLGIRKVRFRGGNAAAISYRVGENRATLLVARATGASPWGRVPEPAGDRVLAWQSGDLLYALVSEAADERQACALCHRA